MQAFCNKQKNNKNVSVNSMLRSNKCDLNKKEAEKNTAAATYLGFFPFNFSRTKDYWNSYWSLLKIMNRVDFAVELMNPTLSHRKLLSVQ